MKRTFTEFSPLSTDGIDIYINRFLIDLKTMERQVLENYQGFQTCLYRIRDVVKVFREESQIRAADKDQNQDGNYKSKGKTISII